MTPPPFMSDINEQCWDAIGALGSDDGGEVTPAAVARLTAMGIVETSDGGKPRLTAYGEKCYVVLESGDGEVPGLE